MKVYYITGISGAGKSAVCEELTKRGYLAYDGDRNKLTGWQEKSSGRYIGKIERSAATEGNLTENYEWVMSEKRIHELADKANTDKMFICGSASNRYELWSLFEKVFCLSIDKETLIHRLTTRETNKFGKDPKDLERIIGWHESSMQTDVEAGAILIDATQPIGQVVDAILKHI